MELKAVFECKPTQFRCRNIKIEKVVHISSEDYEAFFQRPMMEQNFISENIEQMHLGTDGAYHCILVMGQGHRDGILVESEGFAYARYAAYVPDARALAYPTLERFNQQLIDLVNQIIEDGLENEKEGVSRIHLCEAVKKQGIVYGDNPFFRALVREMLWERDEIDSMMVLDEVVSLGYREEVLEKKRQNCHAFRGQE